MTLTLLIVFITAVLAGLGFWFYNRRQINSLTETIEDKNAVINSFREHLTPQVEETVSSKPISFNPEHETIVDARPEKKKQRYGNRPKKNSSNQPVQQQKQNPKKNSDKIDTQKPRKQKSQQ